MLNHYIPGGRPVRPALRGRTGPTPGPWPRCFAPPSWPPPPTRPAELAPPPQRPLGVSAAPGAGRAAPRHRRGRLHRLCFVRDLLARRDGTRITVLDKLTYAGNRANLAARRGRPGAGGAASRSSRGDIADPAVVGPLVAEADAVVNFAAESHVDRSILDPAAFLRTGVDRRPRAAGGRPAGGRDASGRRRAPGRAAPASRSPRTRSTGRSRQGRSREGDPLAPRSPYAAGKAAGELLVRQLPRRPTGSTSSITRGSNTYGPYHHPEKLIPLFVTNALDDQPLPLYGDGMQVRDWLYVADHAGGDRPRPAPRRGAARPTTSRARTALPNREVVALLLALPRQAVVAGPVRGGPARPRPALRHGRHEARRARLDEPGRLRRRPRRDDRLVPGQRGVVAGSAVGRVGRLLRAPVRRPPRARRCAGRRRRRRAEPAPSRPGA